MGNTVEYRGTLTVEKRDGFYHVSFEVEGESGKPFQLGRFPGVPIEVERALK